MNDRDSRGTQPDRARSDIDVVAGNVYDKYNTPNPVYRWLVTRYFSSLTGLLERTRATRVLEIGCGEGHMTEFARRRLGAVDITAVDISHQIVVDAHGMHSQIEFACADAYSLPFPENQFDLVLALEALEHMKHAELALQEMKRVGHKDVIISVPQEPVWRILNMARGAYISQWGNTPGHVRHWSPRKIESLLRAQMDVLEFQTPFPWTMAWCRIA